MKTARTGGGRSRSRRGLDAARKGAAVPGRILSQAQQVLVKQGYAAFTMRRVAKAAGMSVGNLQYHFPTKRELLRAIVDRLTASYSERFESVLTGHMAAPGDSLGNVIRFALNDAVSPAVVRTFRELWTLAVHDKAIRRVIDGFYDEVMGHISLALERSGLRVEPSVIREAVHLMTACSEGCLVLYGTSSRREVSHDRIVVLTTALLTRYVNEQVDASGARAPARGR